MCVQAAACQLLIPLRHKRDGLVLRVRNLTRAVPAQYIAVCLGERLAM